MYSLNKDTFESESVIICHWFRSTGESQDCPGPNRGSCGHSIYRALKYF